MKAETVKMTKKESFFMEFAPEIDIFDELSAFPEWIYDYREDILCRVTRNFRVLCQNLKINGYRFKVKYPVCIDGKWKFADIYIPDYSVVVVLRTDKEEIGLPCHSSTDRERWFSDRFRVVSVSSYSISDVCDRIERKIGRKVTI